jgi:hypothetical protein
LPRASEAASGLARPEWLRLGRTTLAAGDVNRQDARDANEPRMGWRSRSPWCSPATCDSVAPASTAFETPGRQTASRQEMRWQLVSALSFAGLTLRLGRARRFTLWGQPRPDRRWEPRTRRERNRQILRIKISPGCLASAGVLAVHPLRVRNASPTGDGNATKLWKEWRGASGSNPSGSSGVPGVPAFLSLAEARGSEVGDEVVGRVSSVGNDEKRPAPWLDRELARNIPHGAQSEP